jgi:hypothetical protein
VGDVSGEPVGIRGERCVADSSIGRSKSIEATNHGTRTEQLDTTIWLQWLAAFRPADEEQARFLRERFRPGLLRAHNWVAKATC